MEVSEEFSVAEKVEEMFNDAMDGLWLLVLDLYERYPRLQKATTTSGETALHIAISETSEFIVERLVNSIVDGSCLEMANDRGNTLLHLAALTGNIPKCQCIARKREGLVGLRNSAGETPLFLAALRGKKDAFLYLLSICDPQTHYEYTRRYDGETILHVAITGEYFDLAYQIICEYEQLIYAVNEHGFTPLHLLASKPSLFRSGSHPHRFINTIIYQAIHVKELTEEYRNFLKFSRDDHTRIKRIVNFIRRAMLVILALGSAELTRIQAKKEKNIWSLQILKRMLEKSSSYDHFTSGGRHPGLTDGFAELSEANQVVEEELGLKTSVKGCETPLLLAAKNGITEMVEQILKFFPRAILDRDSTGKNIVLVAVENRQTKLYKQLLNKLRIYENAFRHVDNNGNSALHAAATLGDYRPYPFAALQMQWEIKWYKYVKHSVPRDFFISRNLENKTPKEVFRKSHHDLVKEGGKWLTSTSKSCSVVATLVTTVAFATTATVPGSIKEGNGRPKLEWLPGFIVFAISSLIALSFSVTSVIAFLSILTSRYDQKDFQRDLPKKLLFALTSLFLSLAAMLVCFCTGHFFLVIDEFEPTVFLVLYAIAYLPVAYFASMQFPFYFDLILHTFKKVPKRTPFR